HHGGSSLTAMDFSELTPTELDEFAWKAIDNWPAAAGFSESFEGVNVGEITKFFLWDKVGRAVRAGIDPQRAAFELQLLPRMPDYRNGRKTGNSQSRKNCCSEFVYSVTNAVYNLSRRIQIKSAGMIDASPSLYVPVASPCLNRATGHLAGRD